MDWICWQLKDCTETTLMLSDSVLPHAIKVSNVLLWLCACQTSNTCILQTNNNEQQAFLITRELYQQIFDFRTTVVLVRPVFDLFTVVNMDPCCTRQTVASKALFSPT